MNLTFTGHLILALTNSADPRLTDLADRVSRDETVSRAAGQTAYPYAVVHEAITDTRQAGSSCDQAKWAELTQVDLYQSRDTGSSEDVDLARALTDAIDALPQWALPGLGVTYRAKVDSTMRRYDPENRTVTVHLTVRIVRTTRGTRS